MTNEQEDKMVKRMDKMIEQLSSITDAVEELKRIVLECPTKKRIDIMNGCSTRKVTVGPNLYNT
jgi:hypothetical protein